MRKMSHQVRQVVTNGRLALWCLWWSVATSAIILVGNNIQPLWEQIYPSTENAHNQVIYNGAVEATHTILSTFQISIYKYCCD